MISALAHGDMMKLHKEKIIEFDLFNEQIVYEVKDPPDQNRRYCLCFNPTTAHREGDTRQRLLALTETGLEKIAQYKRKTTVEKLGARVVARHKKAGT